MGIEDSKRWHWVTLGLIAGLALSYAWTSMDPPPARRSTKALGFEQELVKPPLKTGEPNVKNVRIYPPIKGAYLVEFDLRTPTKDGKAWIYQPWSFVAETPYRATYNRAAGADANETILTYLARLSKTNANVKYSYAWWRTPPWTYTLWTAGSVLVIGGIWPTILNLLIGAGFGRRKEKDPEYDLDRFKGEEEKSAKKAGPTEEDMEQLRAVEAGIENALGIAPEPKPEIAPEPPKQVRSLIAPQPEVVAEAPKPEEKPKDYRGEYYPTARAKKKD